jgi:periplasmic protein TonB
MTTNQILTASFLDILFDNRNKEYGAYEIRRAYPKNLMKALGIMLLLVISVSVYVMSQPKKERVRITQIELTPETKLDNIKEEKQPVEEQPTRTVTAKPPTQPDFSNIVLVDDEPDPPVRDQTDTSVVVPGPVTDPGTGDGREFVQGKLDTVTRIIPSNPVEPETPEEPAIRDFAQIQPEFPGGEKAWMSYLQRMLRVPDDLEAGERKTVRVKFVVNANGEVTGAEIVQSGGHDFDKEVLRVIGKMPKWKPGRQNGKNVAVYFTQPVTFATTEE